MKTKLSWFSISIRVANVLVVLGLLLCYLSTIISPEKISWLSLFGISFPIWLVLNILFVIIWLIRRKKMIFLSLFIVAFGYNHISNFFQLSFSSSPEVKAISFKLMSYNVKLFGFYTFENQKNKEIRDSILSQIETENPDIICFQEFYFTENKNGFQTKNLFNKRFKDYRFHEKYTHELIHHQYFGVATASKFPIVGRGYIEFHNDRNNFCIYSDLLINKDTIRVFNGHFASIRFSNADYQLMEKIKDNFFEVKKEEVSNLIERLNNASVKRASQVRKVAKEIENSPYPVVLAADFNDTPSSYAYNQINGLLNDSFVESGNGIGNTYIGAFPSFRIDYIFHDDNFSSHKYKTLPEKNSDHHAIQSILELKSKLD